MSREQERTKRKSLKGINLSCIFKGIGLKFLFFMCGFGFYVINTFHTITL